MTWLIWVAVALLVLAGLAGTVLPLLPGHVLILAGMVLAAWAEGFVHVGWWTLGLLAALTGLAYGIDFLAGAAGARRFGATGWSMAGAAVGSIVGLFFGLPGILLGAPVGAVVGELAARRPLREASRAGVGATIGMVVGGALKVAIAVMMVAIFLLARLF